MRVDLVGGAEDLPLDVLDVLRLVGEVRAEVGAALDLLSPLEVSLVHDWAMREHLRASDHGTSRRPRPVCLDLAVLAVQLRCLPGESSDAARVGRVYEFLRVFPGCADLESGGRSSGVLPVPRGGAAADLEAGVSCAPEDDWSSWRVGVVVDLDLPPGAEEPTPTQEAVEAVALAVAGPRHRIRPGSQVTVTRPEGGGLPGAPSSDRGRLVARPGQRVG